MKRAAGWVRAYRAAFAFLTLIAIGYQLWLRTGVPGFNPVNFFSFFTVQSNLYGAAVLLWGATLDPSRRPPLAVALIRGAAVLYLSVTFVVFALLLSDLQEQLQMTVPWVDTVLHRIMPLAVLADWLIDPPHVPIPFQWGLIWLLYPIVWLAYALVRGALVGWYPYPFLDPRQSGGYSGVALTCLGIAAGALLFTGLVVLIARLRRAASRTSILADGGG
jgi:hypothetical protein